MYGHALWVVTSDRNPGIENSIPESGIEKFVISGSRFEIRFTDWSSFWYFHLTYFMHYDIVFLFLSVFSANSCEGYHAERRHRRKVAYIRTAWNDNGCQNTNYSAHSK